MGRDVPVSGALRVATLALAVLLLPACFKGPKPLRAAAGVDEAGDIVALHGKIYRKVEIANQVTRPLPDGRLEVRVELANRSRKDLPVQIQTVFRDGEGMLMSDSTAFEVVVLPAGGSKLYEVKSLQPGPASHLVQVRKP